MGLQIQQKSNVKETHVKIGCCLSDSFLNTFPVHVTYKNLTYLTNTRSMALAAMETVPTSVIPKGSFNPMVLAHSRKCINAPG